MKKTTTKDKISNLKGRVAGMKETGYSYLRNNPEKSVLIAAGVGAFVGAVVIGTMKRKK